MKTAIVGFGVIGKVHKGLIEELGFDLVAICDVDAKKQKEIGNIPFYTDYIKMLEAEKPDVVHICTPHYTHADMMVESLNRNVNVLCEKPMCIKKEDIPRIINAEKRSKAMLGICHQNRYNKENLFVKDYLKDKKILGGTGLVSWNRNSDYYTQSEWRGKWSTEGGGVLINQAIHTLDIVQWLVGMPTTVTANVSTLVLKDYIEVEDTASLICKGVGNGFTFFATNGNSCNLPISISIKTDKELIRITSDKVYIDDKVYEFKNDDIVLGKDYYGPGQPALFKDFYDCILNSRKFEIDGEEGSKVIKIVLSAYESKGNEIKI